MSGRRLIRLTLSIICWVIMSYAGDVDATVLEESNRPHSLSRTKVAPSSKKVNGRPAATLDPTEPGRVTARDGKVAKHPVGARQMQDPEQVVWVDGRGEGARGTDQPKAKAPQAKDFQPSTAAKGEKEQHSTYWVDEGDTETAHDSLQDQGGSLSSDVKAAVKNSTALEDDDGDDQALWAEDDDRGGEALATDQQSSHGQAGKGTQGVESQGQQVAHPGPSTDLGTDTEGGAPLNPVTSSTVTSKPVQESMKPRGSTAGEGGGHAAEGDDAVVWVDGNNAGGIEAGGKRDDDAEKAGDKSTSERTEPDQKHLESNSGWDRGSQKSGSEEDDNKSPVGGSSNGATHSNETGTTVGGSGASGNSSSTKGTSAWGSRGDSSGTARGGGGQSPIDSSSSSSSSHYNSSSSHYNNGNNNQYNASGSHTRSSNGGGSGASSSTSSSSSSGVKSAWDRSSISGGAPRGVDKPTPIKTSTTTASLGANSTTNSESGSRGDSGMSSHSSSSIVDITAVGDSARGPNSSSSSSSSDTKDSGEGAMDSFPWGDDVSGTSEDSNMQPAPGSSSTHDSAAATQSTNTTAVEPALTYHAGSTPAPVQSPKADVAGSDAASLSQTNTNAGVVTTTTTTTVTTTTGPADAVAANGGSSRQNGGGSGTWVILNGQKVWVAENSAVAIDGPWSMSDPSGRVSSDDMAHLRLRSTQKRTSPTLTKIDPETAYNGLANVAAAAGIMAQMAAKDNGGQAAGAVVPAVAQVATGVVDSTNKAMVSSVEGISSTTNTAVSSMASNTQNVINGATKSVNGAVSDVNAAVYGVTSSSSTDVTPKPPSITTQGELSSAENEMAACLGSLGIQAQTDQVFETWDKGVSQTPAGQVASQTLQHAIDSLNLNPADASKLKASYALYDTWLKTGSPSRRRRRQRRKLQLDVGDSSLVNTYAALTSSLTTPCKAAYKSMSAAEVGAPNAGGSTSGFSSSGEMHCNTYAKPAMSLHLCQSSTASPSSSTIQVKGSVTNTGTAAVCPLTLIVENFDEAISFYPTWLPTYRGTFLPGDVATFSVTLPEGLLSTQVSIGEDVSACEAPAQQAMSTSLGRTYPPPATSVTAATGGSRGDYGGVEGQGGVGVGTNDGALAQVFTTHSQGSIQSSSTLSQQAWATSASPMFMTDGGAPKVKSSLAAGRGPLTSLSGIDWGAVGGADTSCLATCMFIINDLTHCEAYDAIGAFRCDTCSAETYAGIQQTCRDQGCSASKCHVSEAKGPTNGGQSVKNNISLILGVLTVFLMMQLT